LDTKRKIGIIYNNDNNWVAGVYYLNSIINVLKKNSQLFDIFIISNQKRNAINDLPVIIFKLSIIERILNKINNRFPFITKIYINCFGQRKINKLLSFDYIFPFNNAHFYFEEIPDRKKIFWIPDFQENYYNEFFEKKEIISRIITQVNAAYSKCKLVLSSQSAYNDFLRLYPRYICNVAIIPFVSSLCFEEEEGISDDNLIDKYNINGNCFICSNQFWKHKNHLVLLEAVSILIKENINVQIYLTGKEYDYRDPEYTIMLKKKVFELGVENNVLFLGFIPRNEQVYLLKHSKAVIQPSLFEGWNTTIEDAKYLGKEIIASDISVHKEQLNDLGIYFEVNSASDLAEKIRMVINKPRMKIDYSYNQEYLNYHKKIIDLFS
jgi:glycosyltransferase involved in cell wall biosynthesis